MLFIGLVVAAAIVALGFQVRQNAVRIGSVVAAIVVLFIFVALSSIRYVGESELGVIVKNFGADLPQGSIIAVDGEKGPQAKILPPGWHFWYWPGLFDVEIHQVTEIQAGNVGLVTAVDGQPLPKGQIYAPEWPQQDRTRMISDATYFLTDGGGHRGPQASVLEPGTYRFNPKLFTVQIVPSTNIEKGFVGVIKSNVGELPPGAAGTDVRLVTVGERGIWRTPYDPQQLYLNINAYEITMISTKRNVVRYTAAAKAGEEREIKVRSSDGFTFPVDVRVEYQITPEDAPLVVATLGDDGDKLRDVLNSAVRAIFRNNAEGVKALDYVQQRSIQESQSLAMLQEEMTKAGVTVNAVRIGDVGDEESLGQLLQTQTDREIALQEQETFREQQRAAEQKKALTRTEQEAEEERRLATAKYEVQIAEQDKERRIIEANAEAEAIHIKADAQAEAYRVIAEQIGKGNAALVELLKIVGERGINITPRVMVVGSNGATSGEQAASEAETTALIGTMLDTMVNRQEQQQPSSEQRN
jgi:uncharacterized membrane protein YqiK